MEAKAFACIADVFTDLPQQVTRATRCYMSNSQVLSSLIVVNDAEERVLIGDLQ